MIGLGGPATAATGPWLHAVANWQHASELHAPWGSQEDQARIFGAVAEATREEELRPIPADVLCLFPRVSPAHALDIIRLSKEPSWRERLGVTSKSAAQTEMLWLLADGASQGVPSPRTTLPSLMKAQAAALERGSKEYDRVMNAWHAALSRATPGRKEQLLGERSALLSSPAWGKPISVAMLQSSQDWAKAFKEATAASSPPPAPPAAALSRAAAAQGTLLAPLRLWVRVRLWPTHGEMALLCASLPGCPFTSPLVSPSP